jgi:hypothetical protein
VVTSVVRNQLIIHWHVLTATSQAKKAVDMSERIKELAGIAKLMAEEDINKQISYNAELKAFANKFAELIINKCKEAVAKTDPTTSQRAIQAINEELGIK